MGNLTISDIVSSVGIPSLIKDEFIRSATFKRRSNGDPVMYTGGFTSVFPCTVNGEKWAFRCWHTDLGNVRSRFQKLDEALKSHNLPYFADFKYVDEGIVVGGKIYPTTRMRWIDGVNIRDYIYNNRNNKEKLEALGENFLEMCKTMHENHFSHGDLQHGNIIVEDDGSLFLIDYDSLYHTSMGDLSDIITGLKDYQHPARKRNCRASDRVDYFSELIIYICIVATSVNPSLADLYRLSDSENMYFTTDDFNDIANSQLFASLKAKDDYLSVLCDILKEYLSHDDINELKPLEYMLDTMLGVPEISSMAFDAAAVYEGDMVKLEWETENALKQRLNSEDLLPALRCKEFVADSDHTVFDLEVSNYRKNASRSISLTVYPCAKIKLSADKNLITIVR